MKWTKTILDLLELPFSRRQRALAQSRLAMSQSEFVTNVSTTAIGRASALLLWEKLESEKDVEEFSPYPDDDLLHTYGLAEEDLDEDIILEIIKEVGSIVPGREMLEEFGPVQTPKDIVKLIEKANEAVPRITR